MVKLSIQHDGVLTFGGFPQTYAELPGRELIAGTAGLYVFGEFVQRLYALFQPDENTQKLLIARSLLDGSTVRQIAICSVLFFVEFPRFLARHLLNGELKLFLLDF